MSTILSAEECAKIEVRARNVSSWAGDLNDRTFVTMCEMAITAVALCHTVAQLRVDNAEAMLLVESAEYKLGQALKENARLRGLFIPGRLRQFDEEPAWYAIYQADVDAAIVEVKP